MQTMLDLPENLVNEAMELANISTKTEVITTALEDFIKRFRIREIKEYQGKIDLGIDIAALRAR